MPRRAFDNSDSVRPLKAHPRARTLSASRPHPDVRPPEEIAAPPCCRTTTFRVVSGEAGARLAGRQGRRAIAFRCRSQLSGCHRTYRKEGQSPEMRTPRLACTRSRAAQPERRAVSIRSTRRSRYEAPAAHDSAVHCCWPQCHGAFFRPSDALCSAVDNVWSVCRLRPGRARPPAQFDRYMWSLPIGTHRTGRSADDLLPNETLRNGHPGRPHPADRRVLSSIAGRRSNVKIALRHGPVAAPPTVRRTRGRPV